MAPNHLKVWGFHSTIYELSCTGTTIMNLMLEIRSRRKVRLISRQSIIWHICKLTASGPGIQRNTEKFLLGMLRGCKYKWWSWALARGFLANPVFYACGPDSFLVLLILSAVCGTRLFITFICPKCQETVGIYGWWHSDSPTSYGDPSDTRRWASAPELGLDWAWISGHADRYIRKRRSIWQIRSKQESLSLSHECNQCICSDVLLHCLIVISDAWQDFQTRL
jgi:hypothetical protein